MNKRNSKQTKPADKEFEELERLARSVSPRTMRPLTAKDRVLWEWAKRSKGRPRKSADERSVPVQITLEPKLLYQVDALADRTGKSRSQLIADGLRTVLRRERRKAS